MGLRIIDPAVLNDSDDGSDALFVFAVNIGSAVRLIAATDYFAALTVVFEKYSMTPAGISIVGQLEYLAHTDSAAEDSGVTLN